MRFTILHTNDLHSNFTNLAKIKTLIKQYKSDTTLILDAGDFVDFKRIEYLGTKGRLASKLLKACDYDSITVGNNETFQGINMLEAMSGQSKTPFLSCNLEKKAGTLQDIKKYTIVKKDGLRFLIIGITTVMTEFLSMMGYTFTDYNKVIKEILKDEVDNYDVSIVVSHIGTKKDALLVDKINGIDIIISGHDHMLYKEAKTIHQTINSSAGYMGEALGLLEFDYKNKHLTLLSSKLIPTKDVQEDQEILEIIKENKMTAITNLSEPLYEISETMYHDYIEESPLVNLIADAIKDLLKADIGIINSGIVNGGILKGDVSERKLIDICPSPLNPTYFEIQGRNILKALDQSLDTDVCLNPGKGAGFRGICAGTLNVSGMRIHYNDTKIKQVFINDEIIDGDKWYKVASSDYLLRGTVYDSFKNNRNYYYHVDYFRDILRHYLNKSQYIKKSLDKRWIKI